MTGLLQSSGFIRKLGGAALALLALTFAFYRWTGRGQGDVFNRSWRVGVRVDPPLAEAGPGGKLTGLVPEVIRKASARLGLRVAVVALQGEGGKTSDGKPVDILAAEFVAPEPGGPEVALPPWLSVRLTLVSREEQSVTDLRELGRRRLAVADSKLWAAVPASKKPSGIKIVDARNRREALVALCKSNAEAVLMEHPFLERVLLDRPTECGSVRLRTQPVSGVERELRIVAEGHSQAVAKTLQAEIRDMMADGAYARIAEDWPGISAADIRLARDESMGRQGVFYGVCIAVLAALVVILALRRRAPAEIDEEPAPEGASLSLSLSLAPDPPEVIEIPRKTDAAEAAESRETPSKPVLSVVPPQETDEDWETPPAAAAQAQQKGPRFVQMKPKGKEQVPPPESPEATGIRRLQQAAGESVRPGFGPHVTKVVPLLRQDGSVVRPSPPAASDSSTRRRVLLVEDNPLNRATARRMLMELGFTVETAVDGTAALEILGRDKFDLILVDYLMPGLDGPATVRQYRKTEQGTRTPVLVLMIGHQAEQQRAAAEAGADGFLEKPFSAEKLMSTLQRWVTA